MFTTDQYSWYYWIAISHRTIPKKYCYRLQIKCPTHLRSFWAPSEGDGFGSKDILMASEVNKKLRWWPPSERWKIRRGTSQSGGDDFQYNSVLIGGDGLGKNACCNVQPHTIGRKYDLCNIIKMFIFQKNMFFFHILVCQSDKYKNSKYIKMCFCFQIIQESGIGKSGIFQNLWKINFSTHTFWNICEGKIFSIIDISKTMSGKIDFS